MPPSQATAHTAAAEVGQSAAATAARPRTVVDPAHRRHERAAATQRHSGVQCQPRRLPPGIPMPASATTTMASPPPRGVGTECELRSLGTSSSDMGQRVSPASKESPALATKAAVPSRRSLPSNPAIIAVPAHGRYHSAVMRRPSWTRCRPAESLSTASAWRYPPRANRPAVPPRRKSEESG